MLSRIRFIRCQVLLCLFHDFLPVILNPIGSVLILNDFKFVFASICSVSEAVYEAFIDVISPRFISLGFVISFIRNLINGFMSLRRSVTQNLPEGFKTRYISLKTFQVVTIHAASLWKIHHRKCCHQTASHLHRLITYSTLFSSLYSLVFLIASSAIFLLMSSPFNCVPSVCFNHSRPT